MLKLIVYICKNSPQIKTILCHFSFSFFIKSPSLLVKILHFGFPATVLNFCQDSKQKVSRFEICQKSVHVVHMFEKGVFWLKYFFNLFFPWNFGFWWLKRRRNEGSNTESMASCIIQLILIKCKSKNSLKILRANSHGQIIHRIWNLIKNPESWLLSTTFRFREHLSKPNMRVSR